MFARQSEISKIIHAHCTNEAINRNYPLYAIRFYRLVQRVMSVLIFAGGDAKAFKEAIAEAQGQTREARPVSGEGADRLAANGYEHPISVPLFDIGELRLRNTDIIAAWDEGLMTWPELRTLAELFYSENAAFVLAKAYGSDADEIHRLWNGEGLADPFLGVSLARFADGIRQVIAFADEHNALARQHRLGKAGKAEVDAFHKRHEAAIEVIACAPLACDEVYDHQQRYVASVNCLYPAIWDRALAIGYRASDFEAIIARAQRGEL